MKNKIQNIILAVILLSGILYFSQPVVASTVTKTLYGWAKDAAGNVSTSLNDSVTITLPDANTYYISPSGSDNTGDGSISAPWASLYKACNSVTTSGNTIHVNSGTYVETQRCNLAVGVSITGEGDTSHIIGNFFAIDYYGVISANSSNQGTNGNQSISYIKLDGNNIAYAGIIVSNRSNVKIHDCTVENFLSQAIFFKGGYTPANGYVDPGTPPEIYEIGNELYNSRINDSSTPAYYNGSLTIGGQSGLVVHDNIFHQDGRADNMNGDIIMGWGTHFKGLKLYNNKFYKPLIQTTAWNFTMEVGNTYGGNEVYNNEFYNGTALDIAAWSNVKGDYSYSWWIHDNLFQLDRRLTLAEDYHGSYAVNFEGTTEDAIFNNNHLVNYPFGVSVSMVQAPRHTSNLKIYNNLFENMGHSNSQWSFIFELGSQSAGNILEYIYIDNNTMIGSSGAIHFVNEPSAITRNIYFRNNIVKDIIEYGWIYIQTNTGGISNVYIQNNNVYNCINGTSIRYESGAVAITNLVQSSLTTSNPLFVSSTDFHLQSNSPAIDVGTDVGLPYNGIAPDLGAYESGGVLGESKYNFTLNLKLGSKGNEVKELQNILIKEGHLIGRADGIYGPMTKGAIIKYQKKNNINPLGVVGPITRSVLNK